MTDIDKQRSRPRQLFRPAMAVLIVVLSFASLGGLVYLSEERDNLVPIIVGALIGYLGAVIQYYFGSSQGSANKQETQDRITNRLTGAGGRQ